MPAPSTDPPIFPDPPLPRSLDAWNSPPAGYTDHDPRLMLCLEAEFDTEPSFGQLRLWLVLAQLSALLGDHRVTLSSHAGAKHLFRTRFPWRSAPYRTELEGLLSWFADERIWDPLRVAWPNPWEFTASRGGGKALHTVWRLQHTPVSPVGPATLRLDIKARHVRENQISDLRALAVEFFRAASGAGAYYGRGDLLHERGRYEPPSFHNTAFAELWASSARRSAPLVPWVYRFNLLGPTRAARVGGAEPFLEPSKRITCDIRTEPMGDGLLVIAHPMHPYQLGSGPLAPEDLADSQFGSQWVLARFARAGMLAVQNMDWLESHISKEEECKREAKAARARGRPKRPRPLTDWLPRLRSRPPRCIRAVALPATDPLPAKLARQIHASTTQFAIRPPADHPGHTLYGRPGRGPTTLSSPIRAGSLNPDRAVFTFDTLRDGWDGAQSTDEVRPTKVRLRQLVCPACDSRHFHLRAIFEYPDDLDTLGPEEKAHAEDFFTWSWLIARCASCSWQGIVADIECA
jgi:hypothetical protein